MNQELTIDGKGHILWSFVDRRGPVWRGGLRRGPERGRPPGGCHRSRARRQFAHSES